LMNRARPFHLTRIDSCGAPPNKPLQLTAR
jgi:hypothetical protein